MRKILLVAIAVAACSDATGPTKSVMTARVNGSPFTAADSQTFGLGLLDTLNMSLSLFGSQMAPSLVLENVALTLRQFHGVGQYQTCGSPSSMFGLYSQIQEPSGPSSPAYATDTSCGGEVDVQSYSSASATISGTFHFNGTSIAATDTVHITDGQFSGKIALAGIAIDPPSPPARR